MSSPRTEYAPAFRRATRWLWPAALVALAPKCALCVLAYAGLGAALGLGGPELCGAPPESPSSWPTALVWLGVVGCVVAAGLRASRRRARKAAPPFRPWQRIPSLKSPPR